MFDKELNTAANIVRSKLIYSRPKYDFDTICCCTKSHLILTEAVVEIIFHTNRTQKILLSIACCANHLRLFSRMPRKMTQPPS